MSFTAASLRGAKVGIVDHRLARRMLINEYRRGRLRADQVCDAHHELLRAARNVGEPTKITCPICAEEKLRLVTYVFGPRLPAHGRCVSNRQDLATLNRREDDLMAYIVEACISCKWHHLLRVLPVGAGPRRTKPKTAKTAKGAPVDTVQTSAT